MNWLQRANRRILSRLFWPATTSIIGPAGRVGLLERGPQYSDWLYETAVRPIQSDRPGCLPRPRRAGRIASGLPFAGGAPGPRCPCSRGFARSPSQSPPAQPFAHFVRSRVVERVFFALSPRQCFTCSSAAPAIFLPVELIPVTCSKSQAVGNPVSAAGVRIEHWLEPLYGDAFPDRETWRDMHVIRNHWPSSYQPKSLKSLPPISGYAASVIKNNDLLQQHYARRLSRPLPSSNRPSTLDPSLVDRNPRIDQKQWFELAFAVWRAVGRLDEKGQGDNPAAGFYGFVGYQRSGPQGH